MSSDPNKKIDAIMGVTGLYARMTNSFNISMGVNSIVLGLEEKIANILKQ